MIRLNWGSVAVTLFAAAAVAAFAQNAPSGVVSEIKVTARKYEFSPNVIKAKRGDHIRLIITALDRDHGFKLEAFHIDQTLPKGKAVTLEFTADQAGDFPFECSHFCGLGHKKMKGQLTVE
jgi:cytochrome c oxidase subunit II